MSCVLFDHICHTYHVDLSPDEQQRVKDLIVGSREEARVRGVGGEAAAPHGRGDADVAAAPAVAWLQQQPSSMPEQPAALLCRQTGLGGSGSLT